MSLFECLYWSLILLIILCWIHELRKKNALQIRQIELLEKRNSIMQEIIRDIYGKCKVVEMVQFFEKEKNK